MTSNEIHASAVVKAPAARVFNIIADFATTFVVEPEGAAASRVTIATGLNQRPGLAAAFERFVSRRVLPPIYRQELQRLAEHAEGRHVHAPVPQAEGGRRKDEGLRDCRR